MRPDDHEHPLADPVRRPARGDLRGPHGGRPGRPRGQARRRSRSRPLRSGRSPSGTTRTPGPFADGLLAGGFDVVIFETGVGVRYPGRVAELSALDDRHGSRPWARRRWSPAGPKPAAALRELGVSIDLQVPEPNTWRETLALLDAQLPVAGLRVAVQEYGKPVPELTEGLERRGARVTRVPVYRWALPEDTGPLRAALNEIAERQDRRRPVHGGPAGRARAPGRRGRGDRGRRARRAAAARRRRLDRADDLGRPPHARLAGRHRAGAPQVGHLVAAVAASWRGVAKAGHGKS